MAPGGGGFVPGGQAAATARDARRTLHASLVLHVPPRNHGAHFISPNTRLVTVSVQPVTASPWPSPLPLQKLAVATPSPCQGSTQSGYTCAFSVDVLPGQDTLAFNTYATTTPAGMPLSTVQSGIVTLSPQQKSLAFTLDGVVARVTLGVPSPEPGTVATYAVPIASPATMPLVVTPRDASGAPILTSTFANPITLSVAQKNIGVSLALTSQCPTDKPPFSGTTVVLTCARDLPYVNVNYDGSVTQQSGKIVEQATIVASAQSFTPSRPRSAGSSTATLAFGSGEQIIELAGTGATSGPLLAVAPNGLIYYYVPGSAQMGSFDPANAAKTLTQIQGPGSEHAIFVDSKNQIWLAGQSAAMACYTSLKGAPVFSTLTLDVQSIAQSGNTIWFAAQDTSVNAYAGYFTQPSNCGGIPQILGQSVQLGTLNNVNGTPGNSQFIAPAGTINGNPAVWVGATYSTFPYNAQLFKVSTASSGTSNPVVDFGANYSFGSVTSDAQTNAYVALEANGQGSNPSEIMKIPPSTYTQQAAFTPPPWSFPMTIALSANSGGTVQRVAVADSAFHYGVLLADLTKTPATNVYVPWNGATSCQSVVYDASGGIWAGCIDANGLAAIYHVVYTSRWSVMAPRYVNASEYSPNHNAVAVLEPPNSNTGPYTIVQNYGGLQMPDSSTPWPASYALDFSYSTNFANTSNLTVTDKNGRDQTMTLDITGSFFQP